MTDFSMGVAVNDLKAQFEVKSKIKELLLLGDVLSIQVETEVADGWDEDKQTFGKIDTGVRDVSFRIALSGGNT